MSSTYITRSGDLWDDIAFRILGSSKFLSLLVNANRAYVDTFIFSAGVELTIPEVPKTSNINLPLWRQ